jgi:DNA-binding transcriptional MerR regulator
MMSENQTWTASATIQLFDSQPGVTYDLDAAAQLAGVSRRALLVYCNSGLVAPLPDDEHGVMRFNEQSIYDIRKIEYLRSVHGINLAGIKMIFELMNEVRHLRDEMKFLRVS